MCSVCWVIRHWILIHDVLCLVHHPSVDPCSICSVICQGGSLVYQDWKSIRKVKYSILSHSAQIMYEISNSQDFAASSVSRSFVSSVCSVIHLWILGVCSICIIIPWCTLYAASIHHSRPSACKHN